MVVHTLQFERKLVARNFLALLSGVLIWLLQLPVAWMPAVAQTTTPAPDPVSGSTSNISGSDSGSGSKPMSSPKPAGRLKPSTAKLAPNGESTGTGTKHAAATALSPPKTLQANPKKPSVAASVESYPKLAELEKIIFGQSHGNIPVEYRLDRLESEVFHHTNPDWDSKRRIDRLHATILGDGTVQAGGPMQNPPAPESSYSPEPGRSPLPYGNPGYENPGYGNPNPDLQRYNTDPNLTAYPGLPAGMLPPYGSSLSAPSVPTGSVYSAQPDVDLNSPEFQRELTIHDLQQYALQLINDYRTQQSAAPLAWDDVAGKVAQELVADNCKRDTVSHIDQDGHNPDVRYTRAGGEDCLIESLSCVKSTSKPVFNKALVYKIISELINQQDDRDSLFSAHATHGAFYLGWSSGHDKLIACTEIVTRQGDVASIPSEVRVGDKLDIKGVVNGPYKFSRITIAWEGLLPNQGEDAEPQDEAMPYFPPLDYEAFAKRSEHDWERGKQILTIGGIAVALAGSIFIPPVALAAPLLMAASPTIMKPKAVSDIPVRGGVRVDGAGYEHKIALSKNSKEGIYYITVWASTDEDPTPIAISRRAVIARTAAPSVNESATAAHVTESAKGHLLSENQRKGAVNEPKATGSQTEVGGGAEAEKQEKDGS